MPSSLVKTPAMQAYDLPIIGGFGSNIMRIIDIAASPCGVNTFLFVYATFQAFPTMMISVTKPEWVDLNVRHRGRKTQNRRKFIFRKSDMLRPIDFARRNLTSQDAIFNIPTPRWAVFRLYEWGQRISWYFLIADAFTDFMINSTSLVYQWTGCPEAFPPSSWEWNAIPSTSSLSPSAGTHLINTGAAANLNRALTTAVQGKIKALDGGYPYFTVQAETQPFGPTPDTQVTAYGIQNDHNVPGTPPQVVLPTNPFAKGGGVDGVVVPNRQFPPGTTFWCEAYKTEGFIGFKNMQWTCNFARSLKKEGIGPDP